MSRSVYLVALLTGVVLSAPLTTALAQEIPEVQVQAGERVRLMSMDMEGGRIEQAVSLRRVDFTDARDVDRLYSHLRSVSNDVCYSGSQASWKDDRTCAERALARAVIDIDRPVLTRLHASLSGYDVMVAENGK